MHNLIAADVIKLAVMWITNPDSSHEDVTPLVSTQLNAIQSGPLDTHSAAHSSTVVLSWLCVGEMQCVRRQVVHVGGESSVVDMCDHN